jgi:hypothetical protein
MRTTVKKNTLAWCKMACKPSHLPKGNHWILGVLQSGYEGQRQRVAAYMSNQQLALTLIGNEKKKRGREGKAEA